MLMPLGMLLGVLLGLGFTITPYVGEAGRWVVKTTADGTAAAAHPLADYFAQYTDYFGMPPYPLFAATLTVMVAAAILGLTRTHSWPIRLVGAAIAGTVVVANAVACVATVTAGPGGHWTPGGASTALIAVVGAIVIVDEGLLGRLRMPQRRAASPSGS